MTQCECLSVHFMGFTRVWLSHVFCCYFPLPSSICFSRMSHCQHVILVLYVLYVSTGDSVALNHAPFTRFSFLIEKIDAAALSYTKV